MHALDQTLQERLPHLKLHPNYLPYIGKNYATAKQKILIIAESHYLEENFDGQITEKLWHENPQEVYKILNAYEKGEDEYFKTRGVIATYFNQKREKKINKGLTIFTNMENAYHEVEPDVNLLDQCIFMNYFQRPAEFNGKSIINSKRDNLLAKETVLTYIELFKPNKVLFVSSLAYSNFTYQLNLNPVEGLPYIGETPHPSSAWWNKHAAKYATKDQPNATGRDKFIRVLRMKNEANKH